MKTVVKYLPYIYLIICWASVLLSCTVAPSFLLAIIPAVGLMYWGYSMANKTSIVAAIIFLPWYMSAQVDNQERRDTIWGVALVLDTVPVQKIVLNGSTYSNEMSETLTSAVVRSYSVTRWVLVIDPVNGDRPRVLGVKYFDSATCEEIRPNSLFYFKQQ